MKPKKKKKRKTKLIRAGSTHHNCLYNLITNSYCPKKKKQKQNTLIQKSKEIKRKEKYSNFE